MKVGDLVKLADEGSSQDLQQARKIGKFGIVLEINTVMTFKRVFIMLGGGTHWMWKTDLELV